MVLDETNWQWNDFVLLSCSNLSHRRCYLLKLLITTFIKALTHPVSPALGDAPVRSGHPHC